MVDHTVDRIARHGRDLDPEAGAVQMHHRQERLDGVVAGGEQPAAVHRQVALVGADDEDLPPPARVPVLVFHAVEVGAGRDVLTQ
jgi:hypothetical protein